MSSEAPTRIQLQRKRGWRMPEGAIYIGRPTLWGNPFNWQSGPGSDAERRAQAVANFRLWLTGEAFTDYKQERRQKVLDALEMLRGRTLVCWCPVVDEWGKPTPCHGDVLIELANREK